MIDGGTMDFNLSGGVVTLEVCHIVHCIPETELYIRKMEKCFSSLLWLVMVSLLISQVLPIGTKSVSVCGKIIFASFKNGITDTVMTFIGIQISLGCIQPDSRWYFLL